MKDDYTTNSHYLTYTFLFRGLGECYFLNLGVRGLIITVSSTINNTWGSGLGSFVCWVSKWYLMMLCLHGYVALWPWKKTGDNISIDSYKKARLIRFPSFKVFSSYQWFLFDYTHCRCFFSTVVMDEFYKRQWLLLRIIWPLVLSRLVFAPCAEQDLVYLF